MVELVVLTGCLPVLIYAASWTLTHRMVKNFKRRPSLTANSINNRKRSTVYEMVFALTLATSLHLFLLLALEILEWFDDDIRLWFWRVDLNVLMSLIVLVIPFLLFKSVIFGSGRLWNPRDFCLLVVVLAVYLLGFAWMGSLVDITQSRDFISLDYVCGRVGVLGVTLMAVLGGVAVAEKPFRVFLSDYTNLPTAPTGTSSSLDELDEEIERKEALLNKANERAVLDRFTAVGAGTSTASLFHLFTSDNHHNEPKRLEAELSALQAARSQALYDLAYSRPKTTIGGYSRYYDIVLAAYCVYRVSIAFFNVAFYRLPNSDPVSLMAAYSLHFLNYHLDTQIWSCLFTLWTVGVLIMSILTNFLNSLIRFMSQMCPLDSDEVSVLLMAYIAGVYLTSTLMTLRNGLVNEYGSIISQLLPNVKFDFFANWFDFIFVGSAIGWTVYLYLKGRGFN